MRFFIEKLKKYSNKIAVIEKKNQYTFSDLFEKIFFFEKKIDKIKPGSIVSLQSNYSFFSIALILALMCKNITVVPISSFKKSEIDYKVKKSGSSYVIFFDEKNEMIISLVSRPEFFSDLFTKIKNDKSFTGLILFSSGSTGKPKAVLHDLNKLMLRYVEKKEKNLKLISFFGFDHIGGLDTIFSAFSMGSALVIAESRDVDHIAALIEMHNLETLPATPTFLNLLLLSKCQKRFDLSSLKMITYGSESMTSALMKRLKENFPLVKFLQTFGTSETGILKIETLENDQSFFKIKSDDYEYKIIDNELWLKGNRQFLHYLNSENEKSIQDGWFRTGDLVKNNGKYIQIIGRKDDIINVGGEKVNPIEVESVLLELSFIADCVVYGDDNALTGKIVIADVLLKNSLESNFDKIKMMIRTHCFENLEAYKVPMKIKFVQSLEVSSRFKKLRK